MNALPWHKAKRATENFWRNSVEDLAWSRLGIPPAKLPLVA